MRSEVIFYFLQISRNSRGGGFRTPTPPPLLIRIWEIIPYMFQLSTSILFSGKFVSTNSFFSWTEIDGKSNMAFKDSVRPWFTTDIFSYIIIKLCGVQNFQSINMYFQMELALSFWKAIPSCVRQYMVFLYYL